MSEKYQKLVVSHCCEAYGWTLTESRINVWNFFERFMTMKILMFDTNADKISPSEIVDDVWHVALLYTAEYSEFCGINAFGYFMHHRPQGASVAEKDAQLIRYRDTHMLYLLCFGKPDYRVWPDPFHLNKDHSDWVKAFQDYELAVEQQRILWGVD
jgi:hypothetical protein